MGDFAHGDLTRPDGLYPQHHAATCSGCRARFVPDDRCYADGAHIWHSKCWPHKNGELAERRAAWGLPPGASGIKAVVAGSRGWTEAAPIRARLEQLPPGSYVMHGGARGVDRMAALIAHQLGHEVKAFPADWRVKADTPPGAIRKDKRGRRYDARAGQLRNLLMLDQQPDVVLAWWDGRSPGTRHCIEAAAERGIPVEVA